MTNMSPLRLAELCALIEDTLSMELSESFWVRAEIASLSERGGHAYLELVDKEEDDSQTLLAKVRANCWANVFTRLKSFFFTQTGLPMQTGMQVLVEVNVTYHAVYGLSLNITNIDPTFTIGNLARTRQQTIERLEKEGIMDLNRNLTLPTIVRRLAVISSPDAAGYEDFVHQLQQGGYLFETALIPATMQGNNAPASIISALQTVYQQETAYDAVVLMRGGGATTDLTCFDDYALCAHCAQFPLPILTGIGHTRDVSILDMVAFASLKTPTALAQYFVDRRQALEQEVHQLMQRLLMTAQRQILLRRHAVDLLEQRLSGLSPERIFALGYSLTTVNGQVVTSVKQVSPDMEIVTHLKDGNVRSKTC